MTLILGQIGFVKVTLILDGDSIFLESLLLKLFFYF